MRPHRPSILSRCLAAFDPAQQPEGRNRVGLVALRVNMRCAKIMRNMFIAAIAG